MAVTVYFIDGGRKEFPSATSATNRDPVFTVARYDTTKRDLVEIESFLSKDVATAEVSEAGVRQQIVGGSGRKSAGYSLE